ncbi:hypothetical protein ABW21_db0202344 [Orbilia brochopaga]|nr:hypothetical protein ABW21_db0202344 [Drechslerella brochopaga]
MIVGGLGLLCVRERINTIDNIADRNLSYMWDTSLDWIAKVGKGEEAPTVQERMNDYERFCVTLSKDRQLAVSQEMIEQINIDEALQDLVAAVDVSTTVFLDQSLPEIEPRSGQKQTDKSYLKEQEDTICVLRRRVEAFEEAKGENPKVYVYVKNAKHQGQVEKLKQAFIQKGAEAMYKEIKQEDFEDKKSALSVLQEVFQSLQVDYVDVNGKLVPSAKQDDL